MSENYDTGVMSGTGTPSAGATGTLDTAKQEAADLKETATQQAKDVIGTVKSEASTVAGEAKSQAKDLFAQTQRELKDQANTQQQRIASGLRSVSDELDSMAANADGGGLTADIVRQASSRLGGAASWLGDRDPGAVLTDVKRYARRHPATFILAATVAGVVVGRLARALASNASDDSSASNAVGGPYRDEPVGAISADYATPSPNGELEDTPIYTESSAGWTDAPVSEDGDARSDTL